MWTGLNIYMLHGYDHAKIHGGEIACLKGLRRPGLADRLAASATAPCVANDGTSRLVRPLVPASVLGKPVG